MWMRFLLKIRKTLMAQSVEKYCFDCATIIKKQSLIFTTIISYQVNKFFYPFNTNFNFFQKIKYFLLFPKTIPAISQLPHLPYFLQQIQNLLAAVFLVCRWNFPLHSLFQPL